MSITVQDFYSVITKTGTAAIMSAGVTGPKIDITGFRIGARSAANGAVADKNDVNVDDFVYEGNSTAISYQVLPDSEACLFQIVLDENVGDFSIGQIGLMAGNVMFSKSVLYRSIAKWKTVLPGRLGNSFVFNIILNISDIEACINLTILKSLYASLPQVESETDLPVASTSLYNTYLVRNHSVLGRSTLASRRNNEWGHTPLYPKAGSGISVMPVGSSAIDSSVKINMAVCFDPNTNKFFPADSADVNKAPVGVRVSDFEVMIAGVLHRNVADDIWPTLTPGEFYCTSSSANAGKPTTTVTPGPYGYALSANSIYVDFSTLLFRDYLNKSSTIIGPVPSDKSHTHPNATQTVPGFMSASDKLKLDNILNIGLMSSI